MIRVEVITLCQQEFPYGFFGKKPYWRSDQDAVLQGGSPVIDILPELLICIREIPGGFPDFAGHLPAGRTDDQQLDVLIPVKRKAK